MENAIQENEHASIKPQPNEKFCSSCGAIVKIAAEICPKCGVRQRTENTEKINEWVIVFLLSIFLGFLGIDRFYVGKIKSGIIKLLITLCSFGVLAWVWWLVDIIMILLEKFTDVQGRVIRRDA
jgi:TM2 domain-containing membrane protein YozV